MIQRISKFVLGIEFLIPGNDKRIGKNSLFFRDVYPNNNSKLSKVLSQARRSDLDHNFRTHPMGFMQLGSIGYILTGSREL